MNTTKIKLKNPANPSNRTTYGSDPEVMLFDKSRNQIVSAIPVLKTDKHAPIILDKDGDNRFYFDNTNAEFTTKPAITKFSFVNHHRDALQLMASKLGSQYSIVARASHHFTKQEIAHKDAKVFGCDPEYCARTFQSKTPDSLSGNNTLRSCGGHLHIGLEGYQDIDLEDGNVSVFLLDDFSKISVVRMLDLSLGAVLTYLDNDPSSPERKKLYGRAGRHRPTEYGVEYRTLPNYWLNSPELTELVYDLAEWATNVVREEKQDEYYAKIDDDALVAALDGNDKKACRKILEQVGLPQNFIERADKLASQTFDDVYKAWGVKI